MNVRRARARRLEHQAQYAIPDPVEMEEYWRMRMAIENKVPVEQRAGYVSALFLELNKETLHGQFPKSTD